MKLIRPTPIGVPELTSTDVAESAADYSTVTTYAKGGLAVRPSDHALFESQQDGNLNHSLDDLAWWVRIGTSNRWAAAVSVSASSTPTRKRPANSRMSSCTTMATSSTSGYRLPLPMNSSAAVPSATKASTV